MMSKEEKKPMTPHDVVMKCQELSKPNNTALDLLLGDGRKNILGVVYYHIPLQLHYFIGYN